MTRPEPGTLWVAPNGDAWRLRGYSTDWKAEPFTGDQTVPSYVVLLVGGGSTNRDTLPPDARFVWGPDTPATTAEETDNPFAVDGAARAALPVDVQPCPQCVQGKHPNCDGTSWDEAADTPTRCPCAERNHQ